MMEKDDGTITTEIATILCNYFCIVFTRENLEFIPPFDSRSFPIIFDKLTVTPEQVYDQLSRLKISKSTGPDNCHCHVLFSVCNGLVLLPLTKLFNKSLEEAILPNSWKDANVTPIFTVDHT